MDLAIGDIVGRKSYQCDVVFQVHDILKQPDGKINVLLKGVNMRILADAPESDVIKLPVNKIKEEENHFIKIVENATARAQKGSRQAISAGKKLSFFRSNDQIEQIPGKVLHVDGDQNYLNMCLKSYKELGIEATGKAIPEKDQPTAIRSLLDQYQPDILVLTGHDGFTKDKKNNNGQEGYDVIGNYRNSKYYIESVKEARKYEPSKDDLVIFAGACQSYYEGIMAAGANFASSPSRILINALDPVMVCQKVAYTPIDKIVSPEELIKNTISGIQGIGGIQTIGKYRDGMPKPLYRKQ